MTRTENSRDAAENVDIESAFADVQGVGVAPICSSAMTTENEATKCMTGAQQRPVPADLPGRAVPYQIRRRRIFRLI